MLKVFSIKNVKNQTQDNMNYNFWESFVVKLNIQMLQYEITSKTNILASVTELFYIET